MRSARSYLQTFTAGAVFCLFLTSGSMRPEMSGKVGGVVELECSFPATGSAAVSSPLPHVVEWVRQGLDIPVLIKFGSYAPRVHPEYEGRASLVRLTALRLEGLQLDDQGWYECRILLLDKPTDERQNGTWTLLSVTAPPTFIKTPPPFMEALVGSHLSLVCVANGNPSPAVLWLKDGSVMEDVNYEDGVLSVGAVNMQSGGVYTCHASNSEGNVSRVTKLEIRGPPTIVVPPKNTSLNMSQNALLRCQAVANPPNMTYVWQKGSENVYHIESLKSRVKVMVDGTLLISKLIPEDSGNYTCMPTNGLLTPPTASATLVVMHPAQALQMPKETYLPTGMDGLVTCPSVAEPPLLRVDWTKDGEPLDLASYPGWTLTPEGSLFMATVNDDAAGVYTCTPYNSYGSMGSSGPTAVILQDPPSFSVTPEKQYKQDVGRTLLIPCQGNEDPTTTVTWNKVDQTRRSTYSVAANGSLLLQPLVKDHYGVWECSVTNRVASVTASTRVFVFGTSPHAATSVSVSPGVTQANVSWEPGFDGGSAQTFSVWVKKISVTDGEDDDDGKKDWFSIPVPPLSGTTLHMTGLSSATDYRFSILSHNKVGTGPFSQIATTRTLDPPPPSSKLKPPVLLSANRSSAGVSLQWSLPEAQWPPVTGFVLQTRTAPGDWFTLVGNISANSSEMIVPGLHKDCVYELRMLSCRGDVLSEPGPSVNVSTVGLEMYPASSRLLETVPEPFLTGVLGGIGFMCLALVLLLGSGCVISHKRDRRRRKKQQDLPPAIYKCSPSVTSSGSRSPDSVLKKRLLQASTLCPTNLSTTTTTSSSSQTDDSSFSHSDNQHQPKHLFLTYTKGCLTRTTSSLTSPPIELISRGPDGRFTLQPYDDDTLSTQSRRSLKDDLCRPASVRRSVSLSSEEIKEPPFVLSVDVPPCSPAEDLICTEAKILSRCSPHILDQKAGYDDFPDVSSLRSDSSQILAAIPHGDGHLSPTCPVVKSLGQPSTTASSLVLQMEHERERGNLSRCLKLAQEREMLERELRKYTLGRSSTRETGRETPHVEVEERKWREDGDSRCIWKHKSSTLPHAYPQGSKERCGLSQNSFSSSSVHWDTRPLVSPFTLIPDQSGVSAASPPATLCFQSGNRHCAPSFTYQSHLQSVEAGSFITDRLTRPRLYSKHQRDERGETEEVCDNILNSPVLKTQIADFCSGSWPWSDPSNDSRPTSFIHSNKNTERSNSTLKATPASEPTDGYGEDVCVEMSVDEPDLQVCAMRPAKLMLHHRIASHLQGEHQLTQNGLHVQRSFSCRGPASPQPSQLWKTGSSKRGDTKRRSQSLDSRRQKQGNLLTRDPWINSVEQENCSATLPNRARSHAVDRKFSSSQGGLQSPLHVEQSTVTPPLHPAADPSSLRKGPTALASNHSRLPTLRPGETRPGSSIRKL
ncbi:protein turtle homolog A [Thalassophryne amazonica]|uniref:protein turtle homolog A n=1 Tax=Thalassophryne amazonica TaxID=390379 RepID=UPI0014712EBD|nr:protein turtle homolog A [Thalassophryne amazonica]